MHYDDADCGCILQDITRKLRDYENIAPKVDELYLKKCQEVSELTKRMRWIPVKERLPEKSGVYWTTMRHTDGSLSTERYYWKSEYWNKQAWKEVVVAWKPYDCPEPYRQEA